MFVNMKDTGDTFQWQAYSVCEATSSILSTQKMEGKNNFAMANLNYCQKSDN